MAEPKMSDKCAICKMRYGRHQLVGNFCPMRGKSYQYRATKFKPMARTSTWSNR